MSWVLRSSELPNLKHSPGPQQLEEDVDDESVTFNIANFAIGLVKMVVAVLSVTTLVLPWVKGENPSKWPLAGGETAHR